jgi:hypothetical protein
LHLLCNKESERELMVMELFSLYTRLVFGATMILAVLCVLLEQMAGVL